MALHPRFEHLIALSAPLWAGEAEVARSYFTGSARNAESDRLWLARQCYKEFWGSGFADLDLGLLGDWTRDVQAMLPKLDQGLDRHELLDLVEQLYAEYHHYCMFADIYDTLLEPGAPKLTPGMLKSWPEGDALDRFRIDMRAAEGEIGRIALMFTEGGYCTLYSEGAKLKGRGGVDGAIGAACAKVYDDEFEHMVRGIAAVNDRVRTDQDWDKLEELALKQLRMRIHMRNGQFGNPLSEERIEAIFAGDIEPIAFDFTAAQRAA